MSTISNHSPRLFQFLSPSMPKSTTFWINQDSRAPKLLVRNRRRFCNMGFFCSKAEKDIWMRRVDNHCEYVAIYVDDLAITSNDPEAITNALMEKHGFKLKGTEPITFHLGCDYFRDDDGTLCYAPNTLPRSCGKWRGQTTCTPPQKAQCSCIP